MEYEDTICKALLLNLDKAIPLLTPCYSANKGRPVEYPAVHMLRSTILMVSMGITSLTRWAQKLACNPLLAVLSGFDPSQTPSVSNFYAFWDRLSLQDKELRKKERGKLRPKRKKPKNTKKGKKLPNRKPGVCTRLLHSFRRVKFHSSKRPERLLQQLFTQVFVVTSIEMDILPSNMHIAADGSPFESASSPYGIRVCSCKQKNIYRCDCPRRYSDPFANWGWDSSRNIHFYGRNLYTLTCVNGLYELPVFLRCGQASRHDSPLCMFSIQENTELLSTIEARMSVWIADSAHDAGAIYSLLEDHQILPVIDLNKQKKLSTGIPLTDDGVPLCPGNQPMVYWGFEKARNRTKWRCPKKAGAKELRDSIACNQECCHNGCYGRSTYVDLAWDKRVFPVIPRGTKQWKTYFKKRTASERINKRYNDYGVDTTRVKGNHRWLQVASLAAMNLHLDAWIWHKLQTLGVTKQGLIARLLQPQQPEQAA